MKILITNDDGITSPGLHALARLLHKDHEVFIVAPDNERSGVSQSTTYRRPLFHKHFTLDDEITGYAINGYPVDCVKLAMFELCPFRPDILISGVNNGLNVGLNVGHSGTVAGAMAGAVFGLPSVALSLETADLMDFERAVEITWPICLQMIQSVRLSHVVLNVNIPQKALNGDVKFCVVPVNVNNMGYQFQKGFDPKQRPYHWQSDFPLPNPMEHPCDCHQIREGRITISPLTIDLTIHHLIEPLSVLAASSPQNGGQKTKPLSRKVS